VLRDVSNVAWIFLNERRHLLPCVSDFNFVGGNAFELKAYLFRLVMVFFAPRSKEQEDVS
jgi:hypothetical protein